MPWYFVITPGYTVTEPVLDDGSGPSYEAHDTVEVKAFDEDSARFLGMAKLQETDSQWLESMWDGDCKISASDFEVEDMGPECENCECAQALHEPTADDVEAERLPTGGCPSCTGCDAFKAKGG